jgi:hypothetical protein|tara:strand:+ start:501 stop:1223 length:723 start_codon:yes stop_codon:yes gene_type:complete
MGIPDDKFRLTLVCRLVMSLMICIALVVSTNAKADASLLYLDVEAQPLKAQVRRVIDALDFLGKPLGESDRNLLQLALDEDDDARAIKSIQELLDQRVLVNVTINPENRVKVSRGVAKAELVEQGWRLFLIKVRNEASVTAPLHVHSPQAKLPYEPSSGSSDPIGTVLFECAELFLDGKERLCIADGRFDLEPVPHDPCIRHQARLLLLSVFRNPGQWATDSGTDLNRSPDGPHRKLGRL